MRTVDLSHEQQPKQLLSFCSASIKFSIVISNKTLYIALERINDVLCLFWVNYINKQQQLQKKVLQMARNVENLYQLITVAQQLILKFVHFEVFENRSHTYFISYTTVYRYLQRSIYLESRFKCPKYLDIDMFD